MSGNLLDSLYTSLADTIVPTLPPGIAKYADDPVGFIEDILVTHLTDDQKIIANSVRDNVITLVESGNAVGKSVCAARMAAWFLRTKIGSKVYMAAAPPEENLISILWGELEASLKRAAPEMLDGLTQRRLSISLGPAWYLKGVTIPTSGTPAARQARFSGKHAPYLMFVLDEADAIPLEVYKGVEACGSGGFFRVLLLMNPRHPSGWVYSLRSDAGTSVIQLSAMTHPNVVTGEDRIPGAVTRAKTVQRIQTWTRPKLDIENVDESATFVVPAFLDGETSAAADGTKRPPLKGGEVRVVTDPMFDYMVLGRYSGISGTQLIQRGWINAAMERHRKYVAEFGETPPPDVKPKVGFDVGERDRDPNVVLFRYDNYISPIIQWKGLDLEASGDRVASTLSGIEYQRLYVDSIGIGAGMPSKLTSKGVDRVSGVKTSYRPTELPMDENGDIIGEFDTLRDQLLWLVREWLRNDPTSMLPADEELETELLAPTIDMGKKFKVSSKAEVSKLISRSSNKLDALALTFAQSSRIRVGFVRP